MNELVIKELQELKIKIEAEINHFGRCKLHARAQGCLAILEIVEKRINELINNK